MAKLIVDASIILAVVLPDENEPLADHATSLMAQFGAEVPAHWPLEIANVLVMAERRGRITEHVRRKAIEYIGALPALLDDRTQEKAWSSSLDIAVRRKLTLYDAAYLELAARTGLPLATLDGGLAAAARAEGIALFQTS